MEFLHAVIFKGVLDPFFLHMNGDNIFTSLITLCMFTWLMACMWKSKEDFWKNDQSSLLLFVYWSQNLTWQAWLHNYPLSQLFHPQIPFSQHRTAIVTIELQHLHLLALCLHSFFFPPHQSSVVEKKVHITLPFSAELLTIDRFWETASHITQLNTYWWAQQALKDNSQWSLMALVKLCGTKKK